LLLTSEFGPHRRNGDDDRISRHKPVLSAKALSG
jgi:hypothetical protein